MITKAEALKMRAMMEKAAVSLDDKDASISPAMFPQFKNDGSVLEYGARINWKGKVKKVAVAAVYQREDQNPDNAPTCWVDISYKDGHRIIPEVISAAEAFAKDELGWWNDILYKSMIDANVYTPDAYAAGWELYKED